MGEYLKISCERSAADIATMEIKNRSVRTRAIVEVASLNKKRKTLDHSDQLATFPASATSSASPANSTFTITSDDDGSLENNLRSVDLKARDLELTEISTSTSVKFRETSHSIELCGGEDSGKVLMESSPSTNTKNKPSPRKSRRKCTPAADTPSEAEIDEFFSVAEKHEQKRFAEKYNYDIVNDVPLEGRCQWIRLKP